MDVKSKNKSYSQYRIVCNESNHYDDENLSLITEGAHLRNELLSKQTVCRRLEN